MTRRRKIRIAAVGLATVFVLGACSSDDSAAPGPSGPSPDPSPSDPGTPTPDPGPSEPTPDPKSTDPVTPTPDPTPEPPPTPETAPPLPDAVGDWKDDGTSNIDESGYYILDGTSIQFSVQFWDRMTSEEAQLDTVNRSEEGDWLCGYMDSGALICSIDVWDGHVSVLTIDQSASTVVEFGEELLEIWGD